MALENDVGEPDFLGLVISLIWEEGYVLFSPIMHGRPFMGLDRLTREF